jgi:hypothetical protein
MSSRDSQPPDKGGTKTKDYTDGNEKPTNLPDFISKQTMTATGAPVRFNGVLPPSLSPHYTNMSSLS